MATDPVQALIDAGALPASAFAESSRYHGVPVARLRSGPDDPGTAYLLRRFPTPAIPEAAALVHVVHAGERPDLLGFRAYGDAELWWRIADANAVTDPFELTDTLGRRVRIPVGG